MQTDPLLPASEMWASSSPRTGPGFPFGLLFPFIILVQLFYKAMMKLQEKAGHKLLNSPLCRKRKWSVWHSRRPTWASWAVCYCWAHLYTLQLYRHTGISYCEFGGSRWMFSKEFGDWITVIKWDHLSGSWERCEHALMLFHISCFHSLFSQIQDYKNVTSKSYIHKGFMSNSAPCLAMKWLLIFNYTAGDIWKTSWDIQGVLSILSKQLLLGHKNYYCFENLNCCLFSMHRGSILVLVAWWFQTGPWIYSVICLWKDWMCWDLPIRWLK